MKMIPKLFLLGVLSSLAACKSSLSHETYIRSEITGGEAPAWVQGRLQSPAGTIAFVGRGGGYDVLDERAAFDEALAHATTQLAGYVSTKVVAEACMRDSSIGVRFLQEGRQWAGEGEQADQALKTCAHQISSAVVGGLMATEQYWEQWEVQTRQHSKGMRRYKCWVLCEVSKADVERFTNAALEALLNEAALTEANAQLAAHAAQGQLSEAQVAMAIEDLESARALLAAEVHHNRLLSERIYYGRRFRLVKDEDCLHYPASCAHEAEHPAWRTTDVVTSRVATPVTVIHEVACEEDPSCFGCNGGK
jgi:hypothetical protein